MLRKLKEDAERDRDDERAVKRIRTFLELCQQHPHSSSLQQMMAHNLQLGTGSRIVGPGPSSSTLPLQIDHVEHAPSPVPSHCAGPTSEDGSCATASGGKSLHYMLNPLPCSLHVTHAH